MAAVARDDDVAAGGAIAGAMDDNPLANIVVQDFNDNDAPKDEIDFDDGDNEANLGAKPKRGRGRPATRKKDDEMVLLRKELEDLKSENIRLADRLTTCTTELRQVEDDREMMKSMLAEKEQDYTELLDQLAKGGDDELAEKPSGIVFYDNLTESLIDELPGKFKWSHCKSQLTDVTVTKDLKQADVALIITGLDEINNGKGGSQTFTVMRKLMEDISKTTMVYCMCLPPSKLAPIQVDLFNHKLCNYDSDNSNINVIKVKTSGSRSQWLNDDGYPSSKCTRLYNGAINTMNVPTTIKTKAVTADADYDKVATCFVPVKAANIGKIIGKNGSVVKKITETFDVKVKFGRWAEPSKDNKNEFDEQICGALVIGKYIDASEAIEKIRSIERSYSDKTEEPSEKKRKF